MLNTKLNENHPRERRYNRIRIAGPLMYRHGLSLAGLAAWNDVSLGGICMTMGRYLKPGRNVVLTFTTFNGDNTMFELKAQVVWCRAVENSSKFMVGLRVFHDEAEAQCALSRLMRHSPAFDNKDSDVERSKCSTPISETVFARASA